MRSVTPDWPHSTRGAFAADSNSSNGRPRRNILLLPRQERFATFVELIGKKDVEFRRDRLTIDDMPI